MEHVASAITAKSNQNIRDLPSTEVDGVLPSSIVWARPATVAQDLNGNQTQVQRKTEIGLQPPDFQRVQLRPRIHSSRIKRLAVDPPTMAGALITEIEN